VSTAASPRRPLTARPIYLYWTVSFEPQNCLDQTWSLLAAGCVNIFTDLAVVLLPLHTVWNVEIPRRQQVIVYGLFAVGIMSVAAGAVRTYYTYEVTRDYDSVWASYPVWITSSIELYFGLVSHRQARAQPTDPQICTSIPATRAFFATYLPQMLGNATFLRRGPGRSTYGTGYPDAGLAGFGNMTGTNVSISGTKLADMRRGPAHGPGLSSSDAASIADDLGEEEKGGFEVDRIQVTCKYEVTTT
jgi:hypothetical protein